MRRTADEVLSAGLKTRRYWPFPLSEQTMADTYQHIQFKIEDRVAHIAFARPPLNVLNIAMMREVGAALDECSRAGELIDAQEALRLGLVNYLVPPAQLGTKAEEILTRLRELSTPALELTRRALDVGRGFSFKEMLDQIENLYLNELMKTEDANEGVRAFMEKRKPAWRNR